MAIHKMEKNHMSHEIQALKNRIKRTESDIVKLKSEFQELLDRMNELEKNELLKKTLFEVIKATSVKTV